MRKSEQRCVFSACWTHDRQNSMLFALIFTADSWFFQQVSSAVFCSDVMCILYFEFMKEYF